MALKSKKEKKTFAKKNIVGQSDYSQDTGVQVSEKKAPFAVVEAYKSIRTNLMFLMAQTSGNVIALSSANAGEGKSTTSVNIAIAFSQLGGKVLLMDGDLRRSSIHKKMKIDNEIGLSNVLAGFNDLNEAVKSINQNLDVIPAGQIPPNPSELLGSKRFDEVIEKVRQEYAYVIIDTPPINIVTDALIIAPRTDGLILVVRDGYTQNDAIRRAIDSAEFANINILGAVMNGANPKRNGRYSYRKYNYRYYRYGGYGKGYGRGYGYGYGYGYGSSSSSGSNSSYSYSNNEND